MRRIDWIVYAKKPFAGPEQVLRYLARYTHRIAISNHRIVALDDQSVTLTWKDYRNGAKQKHMTLDAHEFIRRFLLHVLPDGFQRIRHYGFLANGHRKAKLATIRKLLDTAQPNRSPPRHRPTNQLPRRPVPGCPALAARLQSSRHAASAVLSAPQKQDSLLVVADVRPCEEKGPFARVAGKRGRNLEF